MASPSSRCTEHKTRANPTNPLGTGCATTALVATTHHGATTTPTSQTSALSYTTLSSITLGDSSSEEEKEEEEDEVTSAHTISLDLTPPVLPRTSKTLGHKRRKTQQSNDSQHTALWEANRANNKRIFAARKGAVTISQCSASLQAAVDAFVTKFGCLQYTGVVELHEDGNPHIHMYVSWPKPKQIYAPCTLSIEGTIWEFNILPLKSNGDVHRWHTIYMNKANPDKEDPSKWISNCDKSLLSSPNEAELLKRMTQMKGEWNSMKNWTHVYACWKHFHEQPVTFQPKYPMDSFIIPETLTSWKNAYLNGTTDHGTTRYKILVICGETLTGKTALCRTFLHPADYCKIRNNFDIWKTGKGQCMILDDMDDKQPGGTLLAPNKGWTATDEFTMSGRYRGEATIRARPVVILTNTEPCWIHTPYWSRNSTLLHVTSCLWKVA